jgi:hypothetical protein
VTKSRYARIKGVMIAPGVSKNGRLYSPKALKSAANRLTAKLQAGDAPITMMTHHAAGDDSIAIVGRVTKVKLQPDSTIRYEADIADTSAGRDIASLADGKFLEGVSIRGFWASNPRVEEYNGQSVETADDLEIVGLDFTKNPGVNGARVDSVIFESADGPKKHFFESAEAMVVTESAEEHIFENGICSCLAEAKDALTPGSNYADPGYQADKKKRYPLDTKAHVKAAWSYINMPKNAKAYTAAQLKRIKGRIRAAAKKFGVNVSEQSTQAIKQLIESYALLLPESAREGFIQEAYASVSVGNGPADITVNAYGNDPADLQAVVQRLAAGVVAALDAIDPDNDGDIDLPGDPDNGAGWKGNLAPGIESTESVSEDYEANSGEDGADSNVPGPAGDIPPSMIVCPNCHAGVPDDCVECPNCGNAMAESVSGNTGHADTVEVTTVEENKESHVAEETTKAHESAPAEEAAPAAEAVDVKAEVANAVAEAMKVALPEIVKAVAEAVAPKTEEAAPAATEESAPEAPAAEAPVTEEAPAAPAPSISEEDVQTRIKEGIAEAMAQLRKDVIESYGPPRRKGFVTESSAPSPTGARKPLWEMNDAEFRAAAKDAADRLIPGVPPTALVVEQ